MSKLYIGLDLSSSCTGISAHFEGRDIFYIGRVPSDQIMKDNYFRGITTMSANIFNLLDKFLKHENVKDTKQVYVCVEHPLIVGQTVYALASIFNLLMYRLINDLKIVNITPILPTYLNSLIGRGKNLHRSFVDALILNSGYKVEFLDSFGDRKIRRTKQVTLNEDEADATIVNLYNMVLYGDKVNLPYVGEHVYNEIKSTMDRYFKNYFAKYQITFT